MPSGVLIYRLERLLYVNPAFLARAGFDNLEADQRPRFWAIQTQISQSEDVTDGRKRADGDRGGRKG